MGRKPAGKWVLHQTFLDDYIKDCYVYKRPRSNTWQYFLSVPGEGEERKTTKVRGSLEDASIGVEEAKRFAYERRMEVQIRQKQGLKARRVKGMFDFMEEFLDSESERIAPHNHQGSITAETFRLKRHHLNLLRKFYRGKSIRLEDLNYPKLHSYPIWRMNTTCDKLNPIAVKPPKRTHTINTELSTIKAYFQYLELKGYIDRLPTFAKVKRESLRVMRRDYLNPRQYMQTLNTVRKWKNAFNLTPTQSYNKKILYQAIILMSNSCIRKGELKGLKWYMLDENYNLPREERKTHHLINIPLEITKVGEPRTVQSPTTKCFNEIRELANIKKVKGSKFPHVPDECRNNYVFGKYNHPDKPLGVGTWNRLWMEIKELCGDRYWNNKNITWYSFRHTGISFAVSRSVDLLRLSRNCGTGLRYIQDVYYHHESESKATWENLNKNRVFHDKVEKQKDKELIDMEDVLEVVEN